MLNVKLKKLGEKIQDYQEKTENFKSVNPNELHEEVMILFLYLVVSNEQFHEY